MHGLLTLHDAQLDVQWRLARTTDEVGDRIATTAEIGELHEVSVPLGAIARAVVRTPWPRWFRKPRLVITANDLRAFAALVGAGALERTHPAQLTLTLQRADRLAAEEFAADLMLAIAERGLAAGRAPLPLPAPDPSNG